MDMRLTLVLAFIAILYSTAVCSAEGACYVPRTFSLAVENTINGAVLTYKLSSSPESNSTLFEGYNVSSSAVCGDNHQKCSLFSLTTTDSNTVNVLLQLGEAIGIVTFKNSSNGFTFQEQYVIDTHSFLNLNCQLITFFFQKIRRDEFVGVCQGASGLYDILFPLSLSNLDTSIRFSQFCVVQDPSRVIHFDSSSFTIGVLVFIDQQVIYTDQRSSGSCDSRDIQLVCSEVQRFMGVSVLRDDGTTAPEKQAMYCPEQIYLLDISEDEGALTNFSPAEEGYPIFCSGELYSRSLNNQLSLRFISNRTALLPDVEFLNTGDIFQGDCSIVYGEYVVVIQLNNGTVVAVNLNQGSSAVLGVSVTPPQLFGESVLLSNSTHTIVRSLFNTDFEDVMESGSLLGLVFNMAPTPCPTPAPTTPAPTTPAPTTPAPTTWPTSSLPVSTIVSVVVVVPLAVILVLVAVLLLWWWKLKNRDTPSPSLQEVALVLTSPDSKETSSNGRHSTSPPTNAATPPPKTNGATPPPKTNGATPPPATSKITLPLTNLPATSSSSYPLPPVTTTSAHTSTTVTSSSTASKSSPTKSLPPKTSSETSTPSQIPFVSLPLASPGLHVALGNDTNGTGQSSTPESPLSLSTSGETAPPPLGATPSGATPSGVTAPPPSGATAPPHTTVQENAAMIARARQYEAVQPYAPDGETPVTVEPEEAENLDNPGAQVVGVGAGLQLAPAPPLAGGGRAEQDNNRLDNNRRPI